MDLSASILAATGAPLPDGYRPDGIDILPILAAEQPAIERQLFWRITQHAGAELLPNISSQVLVAVHLFLEMLHYAVWLVALPTSSSVLPTAV